MNRNLMAPLVFVFCIAQPAYADLSDQSLRLMAFGRQMGNMRVDYKHTTAGIFLNNSLSGTIRSRTNANQIKFNVTSKHSFTEKWAWKSSEIQNLAVSPKPASITVNGSKLIVKTYVGAKERLQSMEFKGSAFPRRGFYSYLRDLPKPPPVMKAHEVYLFDESTFTLKKVTWTYLGPEKIGGKQSHKYEIKNGFDTVLQVDSKGNILKIKELDLGLEIIR